MSAHTVTLSIRCGYRAVAWSCDVCAWVGRGLDSENAALREHAHVARGIHIGTLPAIEDEPGGAHE